MPSLVTRRAGAEDAPRIAELVNRAFRVEEFFVEGDRTSEGGVAAMLSRGSFLLAEEDGTLLAAVYVEVKGPRGYFGLLSVEPSRQGQGLGRLLVEAAEAHCRAAGCQAIDIRVVDLRSELPPYYRRLGYREGGSEPFPEQVRTKLPCRFVIMSKALA